MENMQSTPFNRREFLKSNIAGLLQSETKGLNLVQGRLKTLNHQSLLLSKNDIEKRQILEKCLALFRSQKFKEHVKKEKAEKGILEQEEVTRETRLENLHRISEYSEELTDRLSEILLGDLKRKYNMSDKCTTGMLMAGAPVRLDPVSNGLTATAQDGLDNTVTVQHIGTLRYDTLASNEHICQYRVTKQSSQNDSKTYDVFSYIDLNAFSEDANYQNAVVENLLSDNNLEFANANGYIGQVHDTSHSQRQLNVGEEIDEASYYRYQISPKYALEYNGERIEAIRTYNRQQEKMQERKNNGDGR